MILHLFHTSFCLCYFRSASLHPWRLGQITVWAFETKEISNVWKVKLNTQVFWAKSLYIKIPENHTCTKKSAKYTFRTSGLILWRELIPVSLPTLADTHFNYLPLWIVWSEKGEKWRWQRYLLKEEPERSTLIPLYLSHDVVQVFFHENHMRACYEWWALGSPPEPISGLSQLDCRKSSF